MLVVDFDPTRPRDQGQFHVRLIDGRSGDYGNDVCHQNQLGYWCDIGHLRSGVFAPVEAVVKRHDPGWLRRYDPGLPLRPSYPPVRRNRWATLLAWLRWRARRPSIAAYAGDWYRFRRDLERWRSRRP